MFPNSISSSSSDADDHHQLAMLDRFLSNDVNAIAPNYSKHLLPPSFLFPFSPSFANDLNEFTFQYQQNHQDLIPPHYHPLLDSSSTHTIADHQSHETNCMPFSSGKVIGLATNTKTSTTTTSSCVDPSSTSSMKIITQQQETSTTTTTPRKRSAKKDRHSKIVTAQGLRDRRMRLSLDIARRFFTLQDMLGFDKASKTVEWLLTKSRSAIKELPRGFSHDLITKTSTAGSSTSSECEVISGVDNEEDQDLDDQLMKCSSDHHQGPASRKEKRNSRSTRKVTFHPQARESRAKARARARERTMERGLWSRRSSSDHHQQQQQPFEEDQSSHSYDVKSNNVEKPQSSDQTTPIIGNNMKKSSFVNTSELSVQSSSILGCSNRNLAGFDENWELHRHPISTDHSTTRFCSNTNWETYNDPNLH